jgi:hypothetical protein
VRWHCRNETPFPFPWAQAITVILGVFCLTVPLIVAAYTRTYAAGVLSTFFLVLTYVMLHEARPPHFRARALGPLAKWLLAVKWVRGGDGHHSAGGRSHAHDAQARCNTHTAQHSWLSVMLLHTEADGCSYCSACLAIALNGIRTTCSRFARPAQVARDVEEPFHYDPNQLPLPQMQYKLNERLLATTQTERPLAFTDVGHIAGPRNVPPAAQPVRRRGIDCCLITACACRGRALGGARPRLASPCWHGAVLLRVHTAWKARRCPFSSCRTQAR